MIIFINDFRQSGYCVEGIRQWFEERDLDFRDFVRNGMAADIFLAEGDALVNKTIERVLIERGGDNG